MSVPGLLSGFVRDTVSDDTQTFADMLRSAMKESDWAQLHPSIKARFAAVLPVKGVLGFEGIMHWVYCSPPGALIARVLRPFSILPDICSRQSRFDFNIFRRGGVVMKQRRYQLAGRDPFIFTSIFSEHPALHEEFAGGIGMYLQLAEEQGALIFRDRGYFLRLGRWRIQLPRWLTVGSFELLHRNIDAQRFQVIIRVAHPLFGTLFYQRGEFFKRRN